MKHIFLILLLLWSAEGFAQTVFKKAGETIILTACGTEGDTMNFYRKTGVSTSPSKIGAVTRASGSSGLLSCQEIKYIMPSGSTKEYRFFAVPITNGQFLSESNGVIAKRK